MSRGVGVGARGALLSTLVCACVVACGGTLPPPTVAPTGGVTSAPATAAATPAPSTDATAGPTPDPSATAAPTQQPTGPSTIPPPDALAAELATPGTLTACVALVGPPAASLTDEAQLDGYNVAFAGELATRLALTSVLRQTLFGDLESDLAAHACDISVSSQNITTSRLTTMALVPYTKSHQPVVVGQGNPLNILTLADLCGRSVSATAGSTHIDLVNGTGDYVGQGLNDDCANSGSEPITLVTFGTEPDAVDALLQEEVAAYLGNPNFIYDYPADLDASEAALPPARQGIAAALDRPALAAAVEAVLNEMFADQTYVSILRQHLPNEESVEAFSILE